MKKIIIPLLMLLSLLLVGRLAYAEATNRIVAIVNDEIITFHELEKAKKNFKPPVPVKEGQEELEKRVLFQLIDQKLVDIQIKRSSINVPPEEVDKALVRIKEERGLTNAEDFSKALLREGLSEPEFRNKIKEQILRYRLISREIGSKIIIPEDRVREYYQKNKSRFQRTEGVQLAHIFLPVSEKTPPEERLKQKEKIDDIHGRLIKGEDFAELARKFSQDPSASQGGNLGTFVFEEIDQSLREVISSMKPGEFSQVLQSPQGWQIVKVIDFKGGKEISFDEAKEQIREELFQEEVDKRFGEWLQKLKDRSYIQVLL
jgi:peptidyl-prolyl cis-trans isomerase SurA